MDQDNAGTPNPIAPESAPTSNQPPVAPPASPEALSETHPITPPTPPDVSPETPPVASPQTETPPSAEVTPVPQPEKSKSSKGLIALVVILAILALAGTAFGIYGMFFQPQPVNQPETNQSPTNTESTEKESTATSNDEVEITDLAIIDDLDKKIAILFNTDNTERTFNTGMGIGYYGLQLFREGDISESDKVRSVITHTLELKPLDKEKVDAAVSQNGYSGQTEQLFRESIKGIDGDSVAQKYKEIFGNTLVKGEIKEYCGYYKYNKQYDFYYSGIPGCGGKTPYSELYYKYRYTEDDNHAYVYTSTAVISPTFGTTPEGYNTEDVPFHVYCDVSYLGENGIVENAKVCATLQSYDEKEAFTLNASNYEQYSKYRFVFDKTDDGNYYFNRVEKL